MNFDDIRPYNDSELTDALTRVAMLDVLPMIMRYVYPSTDTAESIGRLLSVRSVDELQATFMNDAIRRIIDGTTDGLTCSGLNYLRRGGNYLFVSNHRDITLDAFILQHLLLERKGRTSYIVFGDNLLAMPAAADMFRCNKLISMARGGSPRAFYNSLHHLSEYIHLLVEEQRQSVWIAQSNGRAKDGVDRTAPAIVKMLALGGDADPKKALEALNIVPMSISYEWDPCDAMKANELAARRKGKYEKAPGEDFDSVVTGIVGHKGRVHLAIGKPLAPDELQPCGNEDIFEHVAHVLDERILKGYRLMPTAYAAYDLLHGSTAKRRYYTPATLQAMQARAAALADDERRRLLLEMYANPLSRTLARN